MNPETTNSNTNSHRSLVGVKGWLIAFIVFFAICAGIAIERTISTLNPLFTEFPTISKISTQAAIIVGIIAPLYIAALLTTATFAIRSIVLVIKQKKSAIKSAVITARLVVALAIVLGIPFVVDQLTDQAYCSFIGFQRALTLAYCYTPSAIGSAILVLGLFIMAISANFYFKRSQRVKQTLVR